MLKLLLAIPSDLVKCQVVPFLDLVSLARLDSAVMSHEHRSSVLTRVFTDVTTSINDTCQFTHELIRWLLCRHVHVSAMKFPRCINDADLAIAAPAMANTKVLDLSGCSRFTNDGMQKVLQKCNSLEVVFFQYCIGLNNESFFQLADQNPNLKKLHVVDMNLFTDAAMIHIVDRCANLSDVTISLCKQVGAATIDALSKCKLSVLNINHCPRITEASVLKLIEKLGPSIKVLQANHNEWVTEKLAIAMTEHCPNLEILHVSGRVAYNSTLDFVSAHMGTKVTDLLMDNCPALVDTHIEQIASRATQLTSLKVKQSHQLTNKSLICIGQHLTQLHTLVLCSAEVSFEGFAALARGCVNLVNLDLTCCELFGDDCLRELVLHCAQLSQLCLTMTNITSQSITYLIDYCPHLTVINFAHTAITTPEEEVVRLIHGCAKLQHIAFQGEVTNALRELARGRRISLLGLPKLPDIESESEDEESEEEESEEEDSVDESEEDEDD